MASCKNRRGVRTKGGSAPPPRRVFAIGTWRNLYGTGRVQPHELYQPRGMRVVKKKKPSK